MSAGGLGGATGSGFFAIAATVSLSLTVAAPAEVSVGTCRVAASEAALSERPGDCAQAASVAAVIAMADNRSACLTRADAVCGATAGGRFVARLPGHWPARLLADMGAPLSTPH